VEPDWFTAIYSMQMSRQCCIARGHSYHISACVRLSLTEHLHVDFITTIKVLIYFICYSIIIMLCTDMMLFYRLHCSQFLARPTLYGGATGLRPSSSVCLSVTISTP